MFYNFNALDKLYDFVYEDKDKSVELVDLMKLDELGIVIKDFMYWGEIITDSVEYKRYRALGFSECQLHPHFLEMEICDWTINGEQMMLSLRLEDDEIHVIVYTAGFWFTKYAEESIGVFCECDDIGIIKIRVPLAMLKYILHIKSVKDFDRLMLCFCDFLGRHLNELIVMDSDNIEIGEVHWL